MSRATDTMLDKLHFATAEALLKKISSKDVTAQELNAAIKFLKDNDITFEVDPGSDDDPLGLLKQKVDEFDATHMQ
nr:hypothetical protein 5 [Deltaproteobacteria bacterium]